MAFNLIRFLTICTCFSVAGVTGTSNRVSPFETAKKEYDSVTILDGATELERSDLDVSFMSASKTPTSASFRLSIASSLLDAFFSDRYNNFYIAIDQTTSPGYTGKYLDYSGIEAANYESFDSYVYLIKNEEPTKEQNKEVHIPTTFTRQGSFIMNVTSIGADAGTDWTSIEKVYIPNTIVSVQSGAFKNVPSTVQILCESESAPAGWASDWCDNMDCVSWGAEYTRANTFKSLNSSNVKEFGEAENYIVGYKSSTLDLPLVAEYDVTKTNGTKEIRFYEIPLTSTKNAYDGVGRFSATTFNVNLDITTAKGEEIDVNSFKLHNIYKATKVDNVYTVDSSSKYYSKVRVAFANVLTINDFFDISFVGISKFADYASIRLNVNKGPSDTYSKFMPSIYNQNKYKLEDGSYKIRYTFQNLQQCVLFVTYKGEGGAIKSVNFKIASPNGTVVINDDKDNILTFMFKPEDIASDFDASEIVTLEIAGLTPQIDFYSSTGTILNISKFYVRFGNLAIITENDKVKSTSISTITAIAVIVYTVLYAAGSVGLFFFKKDKYKNDEFRRVKPKKYVKNAIICFFGSLIVLLAIYFSIMRFTLFASTMVVHNPMDAFVIGFSLVGLIVVGYGIKTLVTMIKAENQRKMRIRLKLNEENAEDGTK